MPDQGAIISVLLAAGALSLILGVIVLAFYRRAIARGMRSAPAIIPSAPDGTSRRKPPSPLGYTIERVAAGPLVRPGARDPSLPYAALHAAGGIAFGVVGAVLMFAVAGIAFLPLRTAATIWAYSWPVVLTLNLIWTGDRRRQFAVIGAYALVIAAFCLWAATTDSEPTQVGAILAPGFLNPAVLWALEAAPSLYLLLFLNRTMRTIGPVLLVFASFVFLGWQIAIGLLGSTIGLQTAQFVLGATHASGLTVFLGAGLLGVAAGVVLGWIAIRLLADAYAARRFSEQTLVLDSVWFGQSLMLCSGLAHEAGAWGAAGLLPFALYKLTTTLGLRRLARARSEPPLRLLLLRVFGFGRRSSRLFDLIASRWRYLGAIRLIAAPDLATRTIDPGKFFTFVRGRLSRLFIRNDAELVERLARTDERRDPDGRFRVAEFFCSGDIWRDAVRKLMGDSHLVAMDLRNFGPEHRGCAFELQALLDLVPLNRLVLLINAKTDVAFLKQALDSGWRVLSVASPNAENAEPVCVLLDVGNHDAEAARRLAAIGSGFSAPRAAEDRVRRPAESLAFP